jgi:endonuclease YncB( thermonuclease family)
MKKYDCIKLLDSNTKIITVQCYEFDKYDRLLVNLYPDELSTECVNLQLINEGYAKSIWWRNQKSIYLLELI